MIGAGNVSQFHLYAWAQIPQAEIVAVVDPDPARAQVRAREAGLGDDRVYATLEDLLAHESSLDFVDITAPPEAHVELVRAAAAHGIHILCQKPLAASLRDAWTMIRLAEEAGVTLSVNENWRWRTWYRALKSRLDEGMIGRPVYARFFSHADWWRDPDRRSSDHRFRRWERALLFDWGLHLIDILRFLFGEPQTVYARVQSVSPALKADDYAIVVLAYQDMTALLDLAMSSHDPAGHSGRVESVLEDLRIEGEAGTLRLVPDRAGDDLIRLTTAQGTHQQRAYEGTPHEAYRASYTATHRHFIDCLLAGKTPETHARDNFDTLAIMLAAYHSAATGQVVTISDYQRRALQGRSE